jgi:regulator of nucleoside diphosphate kinase
VKGRNIFLTHPDMKRLKGLVQAARRFLPVDHHHLEALEHDLACAEVVPSHQIPQDVVALRALVRLRDMDSGAESEYRLVFPRDADLARGRVSVLAPIGAAILGYRIGDTVEVCARQGFKRLKVKAVLYPEAAGDAA